MNVHHHLRVPVRVLAPAVLASTLVACGNNDPSATLFEPDSDRVVTRGTISARDTVSVNGRSFSISNALIYLDDQLADITALRTGMQVTAQRQNGVATDIHYNEEVKGPVDIVDSAGNLFVMGQSVVISSNTLFDDSSSSAISAGDIVEVSGLRDNDGLLHATYIEKKHSIQNAFKVQGPIAQLDLAARTFLIGELLLDYSSAQFDDFSEMTLKDGMFVEVKDENRTYEPGSFFLVATKIERYHDVLSVANESSSVSTAQRTEIEIEAIVSEIISDDVFQIGSLVVRILPTTHFRDGDVQQLQVNRRLEVEGWLNSFGELEAWEIEYEDGSDYFDSDDNNSDFSLDSSEDDDDDDATEVELEGIVSAMNADDGLLLVNGIDVRVDNRTEFENHQDEYITRSQFFNLINIGTTSVKVKWKQFTSYTDAPYEVEIEV